MNVKMIPRFANDSGMAVIPLILVVSMISLSVISYVSNRYVSLRKFSKSVNKPQVEERIAEIFKMVATSKDLCSFAISGASFNRRSPVNPGGVGSATYIELEQFSPLLTVGKQFGVYEISRIMLRSNNATIMFDEDHLVASDGTHTRYANDQQRKFPLEVEIEDTATGALSIIEVASIYLMQRRSDGGLICFGDASLEGLCLMEGGDLTDLNTQTIAGDVFDCDVSARTCRQAGLPWNRATRDCRLDGVCPSHQFMTGFNYPSSPVINCSTFNKIDDSGVTPVGSGECAAGELVSGIDKSGEVICTPDVPTYTSNRTCNGRVKPLLTDYTNPDPGLYPLVACGFPLGPCATPGTSCKVNKGWHSVVTGQDEDGNDIYTNYEIVDTYTCQAPIHCM